MNNIEKEKKENSRFKIYKEKNTYFKKKNYALSGCKA